MKVLEKFYPLIEKNSYLFGEKDLDLRSELYIAFIKCVKKFDLNEEEYIKIYKYKRLSE